MSFAKSWRPVPWVGAGVAAVVAAGAVAGQPAYRTDMPAFERNLTDREIWAVLAYIKSRWPAGIRQRQEAIDRGARN